MENLILLLLENDFFIMKIHLFFSQILIFLMRLTQLNCFIIFYFFSLFLFALVWYFSSFSYLIGSLTFQFTSALSFQWMADSCLVSNYILIAITSQQSHYLLSKSNKLWDQHSRSEIIFIYPLILNYYI